ncbi:hypothetical protein HJ590_09715 [Naumannella sp. ID2617S]|nr:hypothetical protein [Naumannella sp. ID2617S]
MPAGTRQAALSGPASSTLLSYPATPSPPRIAVLQTLDRQGATQMRKSIEAIATRLGISRVTAYAYLDEARSRD